MTDKEYDRALATAYVMADALEEPERRLEATIYLSGFLGLETIVRQKLEVPQGLVKNVFSHIAHMVMRGHRISDHAKHLSNYILLTIMGHLDDPKDQELCGNLINATHVAPSQGFMHKLSGSHAGDNSRVWISNHSTGRHPLDE